MATATVSHLAHEIVLQTVGASEPPEWETPAHKTIEREDWPSEWEDEYREACPEFSAPEPKCKPGLKAYKGYAAMSRAEFLSNASYMHARQHDVYLHLYHRACPVGPGAGIVRTSRKELAEDLHISLPTLDRRLDALNMFQLIEMESIRGRPPGGRGRSRTPGRLVIRIVKYQTARWPS